MSLISIGNASAALSHSALLRSSGGSCAAFRHALNAPPSDRSTPGPTSSSTMRTLMSERPFTKSPRAADP